ncbi:leucyl aminopeptidase [Gilvimarinus xylanilyticus]|uniref:Probable cytosol aminopeptidase n=1 Tax=Gilvimarinus xylanilyticus TaxID=2944139 RepID=A0A9X2KT28_9GAMM|nr:leucyl aminopeptidase [Gilvimarinus xylanilyticus]MCP8898752.1 leucyl aminopeptidase [Gilvimarinus xylanilyticus]
MQFYAKSQAPSSVKADTLVVGIFEGAQLTPAAQALDKACNKALSKLLAREDFNGTAGKTLLLHHDLGQAASKLLLLGLGKATKSCVSADHFNKALRSLSGAIKTSKHAAISLEGIAVEGKERSWSAQQTSQSLSTLLWRFDRLKSQKVTPPALSKVTILTERESLKHAKHGLTQGAAISEGINYARELGNLPGNICTPRYLANQAKALGRNRSDLTVKVLSEKQMQTLGMGAFLSVSAGSDEPGQMIVMEYQGAAKSVKPHALVGKGITFDTGGISLKPGAGMDEMKFDMCGAASVFGTMKTLLALKPKINVVAVVAAAENMPSGGATKPGDVVTTMSGQTVEILNTDAEGRLVLCDALTYVQKFRPQSIVDIATLTGACVIALGSHAHGLYSNDQALADKLLQAGTNSGDRAWQMPLWDDYQKQLDSNFADIANIGGREAGSVTAACFLSRFTKETKWAHLDIAGTAWNSGAAKGATGRPVSLLVDYLLNPA